MARSIHAAALAFVLFALYVPAALIAEQPPDQWLRGSGKDLAICLQGEAVDADGRPATNLQIVGNQYAGILDQPLKAAVEGHRFKVWIPVNRALVSGWLRASSRDSDRVAYAKFNRYQLRQAAIDGLKLTLQSPTRQVNVRVTEQGKPVSNARIKADLGFNMELQATTGADGIARLALLPEQKPSRLTAWTDDQRVGGFSFSRTPPRDPEANEFNIELSQCRDQKLRFLAADGSPVADLSVLVQIATPPPHYNFLGAIDPFHLTTDAAGEAVCRWFPDWKEVYFYPDIDDTAWVLNEDRKKVDDVVVYTLKKRQPRKRVTGRVVATGMASQPGGFYVSLSSFQGERVEYSDIVAAFSDPDGAFSVDILPNATYCAYVQDEKWVGKIIDVVPYESHADKVTPLELEVLNGQPVEVTVTSGSAKTPIPNLALSFRREHDFSWHEKGELQHGGTGPQWWVTTDHSGRASTRTLPGQLRVSVYTPRWRTEKTIDVVGDMPVRIELHRDIEEKRTISGRIVLDAAGGNRLEEVEVRLFSLDGNYEDEQSLKGKADGTFSFDTFAMEVGLFASTRDGKAAGATITRSLASPIELRMQPTGRYQGQILAARGQPAVSHPVRASVRLVGQRTNKSQSPKTFQVKQIETSTDQHGNYTIEGIPIQMKTYVSTDAIDGAADRFHVDELYLEPNESRPRTVTLLAKTANAKQNIPISKRYRTTLRDCALAGYRPMIIIADDSEDVLKFVDQHYTDHETNIDVYPFMQIVVTGGKATLDPADAAFLQERNWPLPQIGRVFACAIDADGTELGRQEIDINKPGAAEEVAGFIHQHAPRPHDAEEKWAAAFAEARRTNRRVWVRISQRYCGPCFSLTRWLDDQRAILEKDYIMLKIDDFRDIGGQEIAHRVHQGQRVGIPFYAIFDASGTLLIDSNGPLGNIGYPSEIEGKRHLAKMLLETSNDITKSEIEQLVESVGNSSR